MVSGDIARPLTEFPLPGNFVNLGTSEREGRIKITICFFFKSQIAKSGNIRDTYRTIRKFTFNLFVLILVDLQEVVDLDTGKKRGQTSSAEGIKQHCFVESLLLHNQKSGLMPNLSFWFSEKKIGQFAARPE